MAQRLNTTKQLKNHSIVTKTGLVRRICYLSLCLLYGHSVFADEFLFTRSYVAHLSPERQLRIYSPVEGYARKFPWHLGDKVEQGELLFQLENNYRQLDLRKAKIQLQQQRYQYRQTQKLQAKQAISDAQKQTDATALALAKLELETLRQQEQDSMVSAPISGIISWQQMEEGDWLTAHQHVLSVFSLDELRLVAHIDARLLRQLQYGQVVKIQALENAPRAWVQRVYPEINPKTQQGQVAIKLEFIPKNWYSGQAITVQFGSTFIAEQN